MFYIKFERFYKDGEIGDYFISSIKIDNFEEYLEIPVSYWNVDKYKESWKSSIKEGIENRTHSVLLVSMGDEKYLNFVNSWVLYFTNENTVYVQNQIIFCNEYKNFDSSKINNYIGERNIFSDDGEQISEWETDIDSILAFYKSL